MGYGFPAAIGAQVAFPNKTVIDIAGDGSIQMNIQELATAVEYNLPVKIAILNNYSLGMVRQWQEFFYEERYNATPMLSPDFCKLAAAYGTMARLYHAYRLSEPAAACYRNAERLDPEAEPSELVGAHVLE